MCVSLITMQEGAGKFAHSMRNEGAFPPMFNVRVWVGMCVVGGEEFRSYQVIWEIQGSLY